MFTLCVIICFILIGAQTSSEVILSHCHCHSEENRNKLSVRNKKPHSETLSYDQVAYSFLSTVNLALKLAGNECRDDVCLLAKNELDVSDKIEIAIAQTALTTMPYGLQLLLCSDVVIRSIKFEEIVIADEQHDKKVQTARTKSVGNEYLWRFEPVDGGKQLHFRIWNVKTTQYLIAEQKFSSLADTLRRVVLTDPKKSDIWQIKLISDLNGNFNRFMLMNVHLGEYLYASRGFCYDTVQNINECATRPLFTWEYKTLQEAEEDEYNKMCWSDFDVTKMNDEEEEIKKNSEICLFHYILKRKMLVEDSSCE